MPHVVGLMRGVVCGVLCVVEGAQAALLKQADSEGKTVLHVVAHSGKCEDLVSLPAARPLDASRVGV